MNTTDSSDSSSSPPEAGMNPSLRGPTRAEGMSSFENTLDYRNHHTVAALFPTEQVAEDAIRELKASSRYAPADIGVAMRDRSKQDDLANHTGTRAAEGAGIGVVSGGLLGALAGWLVAAGVVAIPGIGPVLAGGALASSLGLTAGTAAAAAGLGAAAGGITGALVGLGIPEADAASFEQGFQEGGVVVTVRSADLSEAAAILRRHSGNLRTSGGVPPNLVNT